MDDGWVIETEALTKRYGAVEAVRHLDLRVSGGRITGFLGRNGAGKSTTIKMLLGMSHPTSGSGRLLGHRIDDAREGREARRHVAYVAEDKQTYAYMTVGQIIAFARSFYGDWRMDVEARLLRQYDLPVRRKVKALQFAGVRDQVEELLELQPDDGEAKGLLDVVPWEPGQETVNSIGMRFVLIPAGSFTMGSPVGEVGRARDGAAMLCLPSVICHGLPPPASTAYSSSWAPMFARK